MTHVTGIQVWLHKSDGTHVDFGMNIEGPVWQAASPRRVWESVQYNFGRQVVQHLHQMQGTQNPEPEPVIRTGDRVVNKFSRCQGTVIESAGTSPDRLITVHFDGETLPCPVRLSVRHFQQVQADLQDQDLVLLGTKTGRFKPAPAPENQLPDLPDVGDHLVRKEGGAPGTVTDNNPATRTIEVHGWYQSQCAHQPTSWWKWDDGPWKRPSVTPGRDLARHVDQFGNISVQVEVGGGSVPTRATGANASPASAAGFLRDLADDVARVKTKDIPAGGTPSGSVEQSLRRHW